MNRVLMRAAVVLATSVVCSTIVAAQLAAPVGARGAGRAGLQRPKPNARALLEQRLEERVNEIVRARLSLTDDQFQQLRVVSTRIEEDKRSLRIDEVGTRTALRRELLAGDGANEVRVGELLDRMPKLERRRIDIMEIEQKELSRFLSPSQRARYFALQDELRRNLQDVQRRRMGGAVDGDTLAASRVAPARLVPLRPGAGGRRLKTPPPPINR